MFRSTRRSLIFPQSEHARLTAELALLWGNDRFDAPALPSDSFVKGALLHDRGYGYFDTDPLGEVSDERWLNIQRRGADEISGDEAADLIVLYHILRLTRAARTAGRQEFAAHIENIIRQRRPDTAVSEDTFLRCDQRLSLLDAISFHFCFEEETSAACTIHPRENSDDSIEISFHISGDGLINLSPWPFSRNSCSGFLVAYRMESYPGKLEPVIVPYRCEPG